ncbi:MAG: hypothetical protein L0Y71_00280 [Gemmataceae bacterium]|nr:hypothetical protein [Gemmataceae bacterium]
MADIEQFAKQVAEDFRERQKGTPERFNLDLPEKAVVDLVKAAFYASMIPDEEVWPSVSLMCYKKGAKTDFHFLFSQPVEVSAQQIAKLAHGVVPDSHLCCVCENGSVSIAGIHVTILNELRQFGYASGRVGNPLRVTIRGPGHLVVSTGGIGAVYKAGEISKEELLQHGEVMGALARDVHGELQPLTHGVIESVEDVFNDLAEAIHRLGHGGMILVTAQPKKSHFTSFREIDCLLLQQLLIRYWNRVADLNADPGAKQRMRNGEDTKHGLAISSMVSMLEKCVSSIARLAGIDGAIVMDFGCKVVAFNAITTKGSARPDVKLIDIHGREFKYDEVVGNRGSRHQSALIYTMSVPRSFAFVLSQDGAVTAFHNTGKGALVFQCGLRLMKC